MIRSVHKYGGLLRASVASATNDHRLGANEAPPAIISIFLGDQLADVFEQIANGGAKSSKEKGHIEIGVDTLPVLPTDPGDRNRTSPFAFTGNRFEFRAPGSLQSIAGPMVTINTILAEALDYIATELEALIADGTEFNSAVQTVLHEVITNHGKVVFNDDGYADSWQIEAAERGLPTSAPRSTPYRNSSPRSRWSCSVATGCSTTGRCTADMKSLLSNTYWRSRGGKAEPRDRQHHDLACRHPLPDRAGHQRG